ncbi:hypothetical protein M0R04_00575 [Candidatus Dojkabacteria bacterium]|jgi:hypothetical protein|nr:hypothetical protein [Candidatus Dojkabacteria bacterium]
MFNKSLFIKIYLVLLINILVFGYLIKSVQSLPQGFLFEKQALANSSANKIDSNVDLYVFKPIPVTLEDKIKGIKIDKAKSNKVRKYLGSIYAPLASKSIFLVQAAKYYKIDYRLVAAISVIESSGGKYTYRRYNAWGWGGSGKPYTFDSWEEAIITVSRGLGNYYSKGADTPREIAPNYNPVTPNEWAGNVNHVMSHM